MDLGEEEARGRLDGPEGEAALRSLTKIEYVLLRRLIVRQFAHRPMLARELARYGLVGTVQICAATAMRVYMLIGGTLAVGAVLAGAGILLVPLLAALALSTGLGIMRFVFAGRAGREWRRRHAPT